MMEVRYMICHWFINRTDPQNSLTMTLDIPLHHGPYHTQSSPHLHLHTKPYGCDMI